MALLDIRQRSGFLFLAVMLGHVLLISAQVSTKRGVPMLEAVTFGVFAEVQRATSSGLGGLNDLATRHALIADGLAVDAEQAERAAAQAGLAAPDTEETLLRKAEQAFARFAAIAPFWKA